MRQMIAGGNVLFCDSVRKFLEKEAVPFHSEWEKVGMKAQDASELFFQNVRVPKANLPGKEGMGFAYLVQELPQERLSVGLNAVANAEAALEWTTTCVKERWAFGKPVAELQNTRFKLAEGATEISVSRTFVDRCLKLHIQGNAFSKPQLSQWNPP